MYRQILIASSLAVALCSVAQAQTITWQIDSAHTAANFSVRHMMISNVKGKFGKVSGVVHYDGSSLKGADVEATIPVDAVDTFEPKRDEHLKSPEFFDVAKYPTIKFKSTKIMKRANGSIAMIGNLTIHGVTKETVLNIQDLSKPIKDPYGNTRIGATASAKINRKDFGINFNKMLDNGGAVVSDEVAVNIDVELIKKPNETAATSKKLN